MDKKEAKILCAFFIAVIIFVSYGWYRSENNRLKQIKNMEEKIIEYEVRIEQLEAENASMFEDLEYYYGGD